MAEESEMDLAGQHFPGGGGVRLDTAGRGRAPTAFNIAANGFHT